jgi:hypothetical protein
VQSLVGAAITAGCPVIRRFVRRAHGTHNKTNVW